MEKEIKTLAVPHGLMHPYADTRIPIDLCLAEDGSFVMRTITASISMVSVMNYCGIRYHGKPAILVICVR